MANQKHCTLEMKMLIDKLKLFICKAMNKEWLSQNSVSQSGACAQYCFERLEFPTCVSPRVQQFGLLEKIDSQILCKHLLLQEGCIQSLDWITGLSYFPFFSKFLCFAFRKKEAYIFQINKQVTTMDDCNNDNSCLLQCFQQCINLIKLQ